MAKHSVPSSYAKLIASYMYAHRSVCVIRPNEATLLAPPPSFAGTSTPSGTNAESQTPLQSLEANGLHPGL